MLLINYSNVPYILLQVSLPFISIFSSEYILMYLKLCTEQNLGIGDQIFFITLQLNLTISSNTIIIFQLNSKAMLGNLLNKTEFLWFLYIVVTNLTSWVAYYTFKCIDLMEIWSKCQIDLKTRYILSDLHEF